MKYILDLERINQLTAPHPGDNSNGYQPTVVFSVSKSLIKNGLRFGKIQVPDTH